MKEEAVDDSVIGDGISDIFDLFRSRFCRNVRFFGSLLGDDKW